MIVRNHGRALIGTFVRMMPIWAGKASRNSVLITKLLMKQISMVAKTQGKVGVVKYLKACTIRLQQALAGQSFSLTSPRVSCTNSGLPRVLPVKLRRLIRGEKTSMMRLALSVLSIFRSVIYPSDPKLDSIINPYSGSLRAVDNIKGYIPLFIKLFVKVPAQRSKSPRNLLKGEFLFLPIRKSSPQALKGTTSTNPLTLIRSALALSPNLVDSLRALAPLSQGISRVRGVVTVEPIGWLDYIRTLGSKIPFSICNGKGIVGKLGFKQEAAGKMRVFAMVDPWTQLILRPFHLVLFKLLRRHSMDGTFDQLRPLRRGFKNKPLFSMDLSSATDRLPMDLQVLIFQAIFELSPLESKA